MTSQILVTLDVGNTNLGLGCFRGSDLVASARIPADHARSLAALWPDDFPPLPDLAAVPVVACSVNPSVLKTVEDVLSDHGGTLLLVNRDLQVKMAVRLRRPEGLGPDRLVNGYEAYCRTGGAVVVVDFGTAVTLDCVSADGAYVGGAIAPGVRLGLAALHEHTALLPLIDLVDNPQPLGNDTVTAMRSGVFWGTVGMVRELIARLRPQVAPEAPVLATGGDAALFAPHIPEITSLAPGLTLKGLCRIYRDAHPDP